MWYLEWEHLGGVPLGEGTLVQVHGDGFVAEEGLVEEGLEVTVGSEGLFDITTSSRLCAKFNRLEPGHILRRVKHPTNHCRTLVNLVRGTSESDALEDGSTGIGWMAHTTHGKETTGGGGEEEGWCICIMNWCINGGKPMHPRLNHANHLMQLCIRIVLAVNGLDGVPTESSKPGNNRFLVDEGTGTGNHSKMQDRCLLFVGKETEN